MEAVFLVYAYIGFPVWLAKATMLSYSLSERVIDIIALISVYLLILLLHEKEESGDWQRKVK